MAAVADNLLVSTRANAQYAPRGKSPRRALLRRRSGAAPRAKAGGDDAEEGGASKGKLLVLGGTGFVGSTICRKAVQAGYSVVSVSRRGQPPGGVSSGDGGDELTQVDWRKGDATDLQTVGLPQPALFWSTLYN